MSSLVGENGILGKILEPILGKMYGDPEIVTPPPVQEAQATPQIPKFTAENQYLEAAKRLSKSKTVIAGNLEPETKKKTLLG